jgi:two-component system, cell cycle sensor histidine kinase and response regulator CckA
MKSKKPEQKKPSELRKRSEEKLKTKITVPKTISEKETQQLIHELQVHQIELEVQNEELRRAQTELEESRSRYSDLYDFSPVAYFSFDKNGLILETNLTAAKDLGMERSLLINKPFRAYIVTQDREIFNSHLQKVFKSDARQTCEIRLKRKDSREFYARLESIAANVLKGNSVCISSVIDITERKQAEKTLFLSRERLRLALSAAQQGIYDLNVQTGEAEVNEEYASMLGYDPAEFKETNARWIERLHPDDREPVAACYRDYIDGKIPEYRIEFRQRTNSGDWKWILSLGSIVEKDTEGRPLRMLGTHTDISVQKKVEEDLRKSEERFRALTESTSDWIWEVNNEGRYIYSSPKIKDLLGYESHEVIGKTPFDFMPPQEVKRVSAIFKTIAESGKPFSALENTNIHKNGNLVVIETSGVPVFDEKGNLSGYRGIDRDRSEWKLIEQALCREVQLNAAVAELSSDILTSISIDEISSLVMESAKNITGSSIGYAGYIERETGYLVCNTFSGILDICGIKNKGIVFKEFHGLWGWVLKNKEPLFTNSPKDDLRSSGLPEGHLPIHNFLSVPALLNGDLVGQIALANSDHDYTELDIEMVERLASIFAIAIYRKHAEEDLLSDITKRKLAEEALQESGERLKRSQQIAHLGSWELDLVNNHLTWSDETYRIFGLQPQEFDATYKAFLDAVHPDDRAAVDTAYSGSLREGKDAYEIEHRIIKKSTGEIRIVHERCEHIRDGSGRIIRSVGMVQDITERKRAEDEILRLNLELEDIVYQRTEELLSANKSLQEEITERRIMQDNLILLKKAVEALPIGITICDVQKEIVYTNPAEALMHGYAMDELTGKKANIFSPESYQRDMTFNEIMNMGVWSRESVNIRKNGEEFPVYLTSMVVRNNDGNTIGIITACEDITDRKKTEEQIARAEKLESLAIFSRGIAHDFNNMLTIIVTNLSLAKYMIESGTEAYKKLEETEQEILKTKELTSQLLTFSKGNIPEKRLRSIADLLRDVVLFTLKGSECTYELSIAKDLWSAKIDSGQIAQVISNIIINARQAMPTGGKIKIVAENVALDAETRLELPERSYVKMSIEDSGIGIPAEYMDNIFDPFFTTKEGGSGLGLSTSYAIIRNHNGFIDIKSKVGEGTTFDVYIPASEEKLIHEPTNRERELYGKGKILIMEDNVKLLDNIAQLLSNIGYEIAVASDGKETIQLYKKAMQTQQPFKVVIMDLVIAGGMGARECMRKLTEIDPAVKVIAISGYADSYAPDSIKELGFHDFVAKPFNINELHAIIQEILAQKD